MSRLKAFDAIKLVEKLPLKIFSLATWGDQFMLSTLSTKNEVNLLVYKVIPSADYDKPYEAKLERILKKFTSRQITQLTVIPEHKIFLSLASDGEFYTADLFLFELTAALPRTRDVSCFAVDWQTMRGCKSMLQIAVAFRKKIVIYLYKKEGTFTQTHGLAVPDTPRFVCWIGDGLIVCIKKDLYHLTLDGDNKELFLFSIDQNRNDPYLLPITRGDKQEILVLKDEKQISLDSSAKPTQPTALNWSDLPITIEYVHPYILGVLPKGIEVRALEQKLLVQNIRIGESSKDQIRFIANDKMTIVASQTIVYKLEPHAYDIQVQQLVLQNHFELALELAKLIQESEQEQKSRRDEIMKRFAFYLFTQHKFEQSLKYYLEIEEDPVLVIGLYPHLLPSEIRSTVIEPLPTSPPTLLGEDLKHAIQCLIDYLTQMRYPVQQKIQKIQQSKEANRQLSTDNTKTYNARLQLLDTTLLKCYVKTGNNTLIGSLVRLPNNHLHLAESERILRNKEKIQELFELFSTKREHRKALNLLSKFRKGPFPQLAGVWPTIDYLQNLLKEEINLIFKFSKWVLDQEPVEGLKIFTEEIGDVRNFARDEVYEHIKNCAPSLTIPYLEHIIFKWSDETPSFHNTLIILYKDEIEKILPDYHKETKGRPKAKAGEEPHMLGLIRSKLLNVLQYSQHYEPEELISKFPNDDLFEERALLLGQVGLHDRALAIYAHVLNDPFMAKEYCKKIYDPEKEENKEVYLSLVKMYLHPPKLDDLGVKSDHVQIERNDQKAMTILQQYHSKIDTAQAYKLAYDIQIPKFVLVDHFELALELVKPIIKSEQEQKSRRDEIMKEYPFYLFTQHKFEQSLKYYLEIKEADNKCKHLHEDESEDIITGGRVDNKQWDEDFADIDCIMAETKKIGEDQLTIELKKLQEHRDHVNTNVDLAEKMSAINTRQKKDQTEATIIMLQKEFNDLKKEYENLCKSNEGLKTHQDYQQEKDQHENTKREKQKLLEDYQECKRDLQQQEIEYQREKQKLLEDYHRQVEQYRQCKRDNETLLQDYRQQEIEYQREKQKLLEDYQECMRDKERLSTEKSQLEVMTRQHEQSWRISYKDVTMTKEPELGRGAWGSVLVGVFREQRVAVKQLHNIIMNENTLAIMNREINTMSRLRHPNLLLFMGAALDHPSGNPLIITEIMDTSLRTAYEKGQLTQESIRLSVLRDTAAGLNYLHCHPDEIIHRDISSANVLLESRGTNKWRAKLSDFGSANIASKAFTQGAGAAVYSAPEAIPPSLVDIKPQSPLTTKVDVYSFGVLMCEVMTCQFPDSPHMFHHIMLKRIKTSCRPIAKMIEACIEIKPNNRPTMKNIIMRIDAELNK